MGLLNSADHFLNNKLAEQVGLRRSPRDGSARHLLDSDVNDFLEASEAGGPAKAPRVRASTRTSFMREMSRLYPLRIRRIERDAKWLRRKAEKCGLDPNDTRWMP